MLKYYIEREDGCWMSNPEERWETWTRDPLKAWTFAIGKDCSYPKGILQADDILCKLKREGVAVDCEITEHDFNELWDPQHLRDSNGDYWRDPEGNRE